MLLNPIRREEDREIVVVGVVGAILSVLGVLGLFSEIDLSNGVDVALKLLIAGVIGLIVTWVIVFAWSFLRMHRALERQFDELGNDVQAIRMTLEQARKTGRISQNTPSAAELQQLAEILGGERREFGAVRDKAVSALLKKLAA